MENPEEELYPNCDLTIWLRSCTQEVTEKVAGNVVFGTIPKWLNGSLVRNGPGGINVYGETNASPIKHLFDGPGLLQKFEFSNGRAAYTNRFIQTMSHQRNTEAQRLVLSEFGTVATPDPCQSIFKRISAIFTNHVEETLTDTANISIHPFGDEIYSLAETPFAHRIELEDLTTLQNVNVNAEIGIINHTSHPHVDNVNGKVYNIGQKLDLWHGPHYIIVEMDTANTSSKKKKVVSFENSDEDTNQNQNQSQHQGQGQPPSPWSTAKVLATIPSRWLLNICYMHSFCLTDHYFILIEQPLSIFFPEMPINFITGRKPIASCLKYYPDEDTIFHVIPRKTGREDEKEKNRSRKTFRSRGFFFLHTINAFERKKMKKDTTDCTELIVDICCYNDPKMIDCMYVDSLKNAHSNPDYANLFRGRPKRFRMELNDNDSDNKELLNESINSKNPSSKDGDGIPLITEELIVDFGCETPRINYDLYDGKEYTFFYAISSDVDLEHPGWLVKVNTEQKTWESWGEPELHSYPSEPIFIPSPNSKAEDDGIVLSTLLYGGENVKGPNRTNVIILDAQKWTPLSKVDFDTGTSIPKCLHGWFFPKQTKQQSQNQATDLLLI